MIWTSPSAGLTAICTLEPPHSTPISRMMATEASRRRWYSCCGCCGEELFFFLRREKVESELFFRVLFSSFVSSR
jgi:hypothetical protein